MFWTSWRQHRAELAVGAAIFAALVTAAIIVGNVARDRAHSLKLSTCGSRPGGCGAALDALHSDFHTIPPFTAALVAVPLIAGMFWAAPLVSREYEAGTHRLAWTQSVSPARWVLNKVALVFTVGGIFALVLGLLVTWALDPLVPAFGGRFNSSWYDIQGVVPVACMLFALSLGLVLSTAIRRTIPAMALTLVGYAAARIPIHWIRANFAPMTSQTAHIALSAIMPTPFGPMMDYQPSLPAGAFQASVTIKDSAGRTLPTHGGNLAVLQHFCPTLQPQLTFNGIATTPIPQTCQTTLANAQLTVKVTYQTANHFWFIQAVESAIFVVVAALLVSATVYLIARRRPI